MAGNFPNLPLGSWHATEEIGKMFTRGRDSQLLSHFLARTIFLAQFCTISKSPLFHQSIGELKTFLIVASIKYNKYSKFRQTLVGLSSENIIGDSLTSRVTNSYAMRDRNDLCWLSGKSHPFEWSNCALKPEWNGIGDVFGCGVSLNPVNELSIFFTGNGILMGQSPSN
jgi:hypothetical protein